MLAAWRSVLDAPLAIIDKRRESPGRSEVMNVIGDVAGRTCLLVDDIIDSGGTLRNASDALLSSGASDAVAYATHGVLLGCRASEAIEGLESSSLSSVTLTDTIADNSDGVSFSRWEASFGHDRGFDG